MNNKLYAIDTSLLEDEEVFRSHYARMSLERRKKIDAFRFDKDKRLSLGAGILLQRGLSDFGVLSYGLEYNQNGKPFLKDREDLFFNISHSGKVAVCVFSKKNVGVDIEEQTEFSETLTKRIYCREEIDLIEKQDVSADRLYTKLWTIKESLMKYLGTGLTLDPRKITVDMNEPISAFTKEYDCSPLRFTCFESEGYALCVCSEYDNFSDEIMWFTV